MTYTSADSLFWSREQADIAGKEGTLPQHLIEASAAVCPDLQLWIHWFTKWLCPHAAGCLGASINEPADQQHLCST